MIQRKTKAAGASHSERVLPVHFIRSHDGRGDPCYFVLRASKASFRRLMTAQERHKAIDIADYGEVLISGFGPHPSAIARGELRDKYGIELPQNL